MRTFCFAVSLLAVGACATEPEPVPSGQDLMVLVPGMSLDGFTVYEVEELQNDERAGESHYIYLDYLEDAVRLPGPSFAVSEEDLETLYVAGEVTVERYLWGTEEWEDGLRLVVNPRLHFDMKIEDFEEEVTPLAMVEMTLEDGVADTAFIMLGNGRDGVAHDIVITAVVDGEPGESRGSYTLEMRGNDAPL